MQQHSLLATKLYIPPIRPELVSRPRLVERLNAGLGQNGFQESLGCGRKLTVISAPAGFGKTTLVIQWLNSTPCPSTWLSLDESDNDVTRFLTYFVAALRAIEAKVGQGVLGALQSPGFADANTPPLAEAVLTSLINDALAIPNSFIFVLDDYHLIEAQAIHDALTFLIEHLPPQWHLVIASREDPPLPLARLRARGQLTELRATDLRFTSSEAAEFLNRVMGLDLSAEDSAALETRTEGWIAGLQLAAVSMQGREDASSLIRSFTGSHRYVLDYLVEEILEQQSESVQTFLLQTAVLDRLTGSLCDAVRFGSAETPSTARADAVRFGGAKSPSSSSGTAVLQGTAEAPTAQESGQATLEMLERANLFIIPLDEERRWYRYHHLFADLLRRRLRQTQWEQVPMLHQRASEWYKENGLIPDAVNHALAASDFEQASELIGQVAWATLMRGEVKTLLRWLDALPDAEVRSRSELVMLHTWILALMGQLDDAESYLSSSHVPHERGEMAAVRGYIAHHRQETVEAIERCQEALELLPEEQWFPRGAVAVILGAALLRRGDPVAASQAMSQAIEIGQTASQTYLTIVATAGLGEAQEMQGLLGRAVQTCREALQLASEYSSEPMPFAGMAYIGLAGPLYERNDIDSAMRCVKNGLDLGKQATNIDTVADGYFGLARLHRALGNHDGALEAIQEVEDLAQRGGDSYWMARACAFRSQSWLERGNIPSASRCAQACRSHAGEGIGLVREFAEIAAARVLVARVSSPGATQSDEASQSSILLAGLLQAAEAAARMGSMIKLLALQALAFQAQNDTDRAMSALERALSLAEPEGYVRTFVDEGPPMAQLLYTAAASGMMPDYIGRLLAAFEGATKDHTDAHIRPTTESSPSSFVLRPSSDLVEPLSKRELQVLQLIAKGLTNREIASRLFLSLNTVKAHTRNIYGKLGVHSRTQAVAKAQALGVLPSI